MNVSKNTKLPYLAAILFALVLFGQGRVKAADVPSLKEGTYLTGQTLSVWPSWSLLGNSLGVVLPTDPINQLATAGTCAVTTNRFCTKDSDCPAAAATTTPEKCVIHDPETGWSVADRRFSFACSKDSYAYRYIASTTPGVYTVRARFEDPGISPANNNSFISGFVSTSIFKINESSGVCYFDQEISSMQSGVCGDGKLNLSKGEKCDPPGRIEYAVGCRGTIKDLSVCNRNCQWTASTTLCGSLSKCGNGIREFGETCDDGAFNGKYNKCNITCTGISALGKCGDGITQSLYEVCDPGTPGVEKYAASRAASCSWDCQNFGPYCGDKIINGPEQCDGSQACTIDGDPGVKICTGGCKMSPAATSTAAWICTATSTPSATTTAPGSCGDNVVNSNEVCDRGAANNGKPCVPAYGAPCSYCSSDCQNTIDVQPLQYCGNGVIEASERCEVSGGNIFSVAATTGWTFPIKNTARNGYQELACANETPALAHTIKKGVKECADCAAGVVRNCVQCGASVNGVRVEGSALNVLEPKDPLFTKKVINSSLNLLVSDQFSKSGCTLENNHVLCQSLWLHPISSSSFVARAAKTPASADLVSYTLTNPYISGNPPALINSDPLCSADDTFKDKYQMYINNDFSKPLAFPVVAEPKSWEYDLVLSPVVSSTLRAKDLRVVVSWVGSGDFYSGVLNPFISNPQVEGPSYVFPCSDPTDFICALASHQYATGINYYNFTTDGELVYKRNGIWYHGFNFTPGQTSAEAFTVDTGAMSGNTYSFYVRAPNYPIRIFKNTAKLKVDVYLPENDKYSYHFGTPVKTYYFQAASPSDNQNARYWQVFNVNAPSSNLSVSDIIDVNAIVTGPAYFQYTNPLLVNPPCTSADWKNTSPPQICPPSGELTVTWEKKSTSNCVDGVTHQSVEVIPCTYVGETVPSVPLCTDADWTYTLSACTSANTRTRTWTKIRSCEGGVTHPATETIGCTYIAPPSGGGLLQI